MTKKRLFMRDFAFLCVAFVLKIMRTYKHHHELPAENAVHSLQEINL